MEMRNLGDKYYARLDQSDSHGRNIINQTNVLVKTRPVHKEKKRPLEVPKVGDMFCPTL